MTNAAQHRRTPRYQAPPAGLGRAFVLFTGLLVCAGTFGFFLRYRIAVEVLLQATRTPRPTTPQPELSRRLCAILLHDAKANRRARAAELLQRHCLLDPDVPATLVLALGDADPGVERVALRGLESLKKEGAASEIPAWLSAIRGDEDVVSVLRRARDERVRRGFLALLADANPSLVGPAARFLLSEDGDLRTCEAAIHEMEQVGVYRDISGPAACLFAGHWNPNPLVADECGDMLAACDSRLQFLETSDLLRLVRSSPNVRLIGYAIAELDHRICPDLDTVLGERMSRDGNCDVAVFLVSEPLLRLGSDRVIHLLQTGATNPHDDVREVYEKTLADRLGPAEDADGK